MSVKVSWANKNSFFFYRLTDWLIDSSFQEALALNFRNYRVRMPKQRYDALVSGSRNSYFFLKIILKFPISDIISAAMFEPNYGRDDPSLISPSGVHTPQQRMNLQVCLKNSNFFFSNLTKNSRRWSPWCKRWALIRRIRWISTQTKKETRRRSI